MKKFTLIGAIFLSLFNVYAQDLIDLNIEHKCSRAKFYKNHHKTSKDIIQTPLLYDYDVKFYFLDLNVENNTVDISGNVTINASVVAAELDTFALELVDELTTDSVLINGISLTFFHINNEIFVPLILSLEQGANFSAQIFYHGTPPSGGFFSGISTEYDSTWNKNVTWTLSEPFNARQWWPVKQVLTDKADSVWCFFTTSNTNKVGSQGLLTAVTPMPDEKVRYEWKSRYPIDYYLISFSVAEYQDYSIYAKPAELQGDSILVQNFIYDSPGCLPHYKSDLDRTAVYLEFLSERFSLYPFFEEKYGHCQAALSGGMEHQTMTTLDGFGISIVSHELCHMWFGDNVTCATWSDIWLNEGFATYADFLATYDYAGGEYPKIWLNNAHNFVKSQPDGSIYVPPEEVAYDNVERIFDSRLSYWKGALIIHMIRFELQNDELFFQVLKNYQIQFADSTATATDFINVLNETTGSDFTEFFDQWYYGEGYPVYNLDWEQENGYFKLESAQTASAPEITPLFKMHIPYKLLFNDGTDTTIILYQSNNDTIFSIPINKTIDDIQVDPDNWVLKEVASINSVNENSDDLHFSLFPNPANAELNIYTKTTSVYKVSIFNLSGKEFYNNEVKQPNIKINVSDLKPGAYLIKIEYMSKTYSKKFMKI